MSFQAYIDNIKTKTGMTPADFQQRQLLRDGKKFAIVHVTADRLDVGRS